MKANLPKTSELNPPDNITPSLATTLSGIMVLLPIGVFLIEPITAPNTITCLGAIVLR
jgi:hypothetical protein